MAIMLNSSPFFMLLSFILFLLIGYRKIWPDILNNLKNNIEKIKDEFDSLESQKAILKQDLDRLISNHDAFRNDLKKIHDTSLEHAENIKNVYMNDMEILSKQQFSQLEKIQLRLIQRFENDTLDYLAKKMSFDLNLFFETQKDNHVFHQDALKKSLLLLRNHNY
jgi:F0F1-type ATP synthase membrane subunit b/b'